MLKENGELRTLARMQLRGQWLEAIGTSFIYHAILSAAAGLTYVGQLIVGGPLTLGLSAYFLNRARGRPAGMKNLFEGFNNFGPSLLLYVLYLVFLFLWTLLLVIPGIVKFYGYSMAFYIMRDEPGIGALEAITKSRKMMDGRKGKLFRLHLGFLGWFLLCLLSCGIGFLWLVPYVEASTANFYLDLKENEEAKTLPEIQ